MHFSKVRPFYNISRINTSLDLEDKSTGLTSKALKAPVSLRWFILTHALAYITRFAAVNSGLESSFKEMSMTCLLSSEV